MRNSTSLVFAFGDIKYFWWNAPRFMFICPTQGLGCFFHLRIESCQFWKIMNSLVLPWIYVNLMLHCNRRNIQHKWSKMVTYDKGAMGKRQSCYLCEGVQFQIWRSGSAHREHDILMKINKRSRESIPGRGKTNTSPLVEMVWGWEP